MNIKTIFLSLALLFASPSLHAEKNRDVSFLLQANDDTSFMHYEFHDLAYEAATKKDYENAFRIYLNLAKKGDSRAEYNIGMMYMKGLGVEHKKMDAYKWLRRASKHGNQEAILYFKQMRESYEKRDQAQSKKSAPVKKKEIVKQEEPETVEENLSTPPPKKPEVIKTVPSVQTAKKTTTKQVSQKKGFPILYLLIAGALFILLLALFFFKRSSAGKTKGQKAPQSTLKYKSQMYDITYEHITKYHSELLKQINLTQIKHDKKKTQIYYMFLYGMIDYFCQLEKFSDSEQRRIFNTHMGKQEGKENLTALTQSILEGQREPSMYHYQAAGGISAKEWYEKDSKDALSMLKKLLTQER